MTVAVVMPRQGQSVETCILGQWHKSVGDPVASGDLLFSYETDKAAFDEEAGADGILLAQLYATGDEVPVLAQVAVIGQPGETIKEFSHSTDSTLPAGLGVPGEMPAAEVVVEYASAGIGGRLRISPLARNMARDLGVDCSELPGTGPQGRIIARDIQSAVGRHKGSPTSALSGSMPTGSSEQVSAVSEESLAQGFDAGYRIEPLSNMRKLIARAMHQSLQNSAQLTHHLSADARAMLSARKKFRRAFEEGQMAENVTVNDLVCFSVIRALSKFPRVNAHLLIDEMKLFGKVHLGLAVDTERGLMVPVLRDADDFSLTGLSSQLRSLAESCRRGNINPDLLLPEAATFTVSNLGNYGVEMFTPVINLPQTAILGVCTIMPRPRDLGDGVYAFVPVIGLSLTYDHRALDGGEATRFLSAVAHEIESIEP